MGWPGSPYPSGHSRPPAPLSPDVALHPGAWEPLEEEDGPLPCPGD